jgi:hypothetical protein
MEDPYLFNGSWRNTNILDIDATSQLPLNATAVYLGDERLKFDLQSKLKDITSFGLRWSDRRAQAQSNPNASKYDLAVMAVSASSYAIKGTPHAC